MIVCSCNVLSDDDVRAAVAESDDAVRHAKQIYGCLGCSAECGRCARTIKTIINEACAEACCADCPEHSAAETEAEEQVEYALAAA
jgi:bacterioferritin-associated ferredoxin